MRSLSIRIILPLLVFLAASCQSQPPPVLTFADYRSAFNKAISDYFQRCGLLDASQAPRLPQTSLLAIAPELQGIIDQEVTIGRVQLTTDCFANLKTAPCDITYGLATIDSCTLGGKQYMPQVPLGRLCRLQGECMGGYCDLGAVRKPCGTGVCSAYLPVGTLCGSGRGQCDPDKATCVSDGTDTTCRTRSGPGGNCLSDADCIATSACHDAGTGQKQCALRQTNLGTGSTCDPEQSSPPCKTTDRCVQSDPTQPYQCTRAVAAGGPCYSTLECDGTLVCVGANVAMMQKGACQPQGKQGASCTAAGAICQLTLYCSQDGTCKSAGDVGQSCESVIGGQACLSGLCSATAPSPGQCLDRKDDGASCTSAGECKSGVCDKNQLCSSVCAPLR